MSDVWIDRLGCLPAACGPAPSADAPRMHGHVLDTISAQAAATQPAEAVELAGDVVDAAARTAGEVIVLTEVGVVPRLGTQAAQLEDAAGIGEQAQRVVDGGD